VLSEKEKIGKLETFGNMSDQGSRKIIVHRSRTVPTGSYASEKILVGYEQDLAALNDLPTELRKGLALLDVILTAEMARIMKEAMKETGQKVSNQSKQSFPSPAEMDQGLRMDQSLRRLASRDRETAAPPKTPTETPELYASVLESLEWTPGARAGREWILIPRNEEKLRAVLNLMRQIDANGYHTVGKWKYRIEADFLARYGSTKPKQTQLSGAVTQ
jgi:hypothetical protein